MATMNNDRRTRDCEHRDRRAEEDPVEERERGDDRADGRRAAPAPRSVDVGAAILTPIGSWMTAWIARFGELLP